MELSADRIDSQTDLWLKASLESHEKLQETIEDILKSNFSPIIIEMMSNKLLLLSHEMLNIIPLCEGLMQSNLKPRYNHFKREFIASIQQVAKRIILTFSEDLRSRVILNFEENQSGIGFNLDYYNDIFKCIIMLHKNLITNEDLLLLIMKEVYYERENLSVIETELKDNFLIDIFSLIANVKLASQFSRLFIRLIIRYQYERRDSKDKNELSQIEDIKGSILSFDESLLLVNMNDVLTKSVCKLCEIRFVDLKEHCYNHLVSYEHNLKFNAFLSHKLQELISKNNYCYLCKCLCENVDAHLKSTKLHQLNVKCCCMICGCKVIGINPTDKLDDQQNQFKSIFRKHIASDEHLKAALSCCVKIVGADIMQMHYEKEEIPQLLCNINPETIINTYFNKYKYLLNLPVKRQNAILVEENYKVKIALLAFVNVFIEHEMTISWKYLLLLKFGRDQDDLADLIHICSYQVTIYYEKNLYLSPTILTEKKYKMKIDMFRTKCYLKFIKKYKNVDDTKSPEFIKKLNEIMKSILFSEFIPVGLLPRCLKGLSKNEILSIKEK